MKACPNIYYKKEYVYNNEANYLMTACDMVVLPYRKAYMSGVVFTCVEFGKAFLATNWGVVKEYAENEKDGYIVDNDDEKLKGKLLDINENVSREHLAEMGSHLKIHFETEFSWKNIERGVISEYERILSE